MTLVESLKKFLTKLGGNPNELENNATSAEIIDAISEAYTDKEGTYTEVTPIGSEGTKIATITTNNIPHDIYVPDPPAKAQISLSIGNVTYEDYQYKVPVTMSGTEEQILTKLESNTKDTIQFTCSASNSYINEVKIDMYSIYHNVEKDRWMITINLIHHISNEYFEGYLEYHFSWTKSNGSWDKTVGSGEIDEIRTNRLGLTIDSNRKLIYHYPWKTSGSNSTHTLKFMDLEESLFGRLGHNKLDINVVVKDESGYLGSSVYQRPKSYLASFCAWGGAYGANNEKVVYIPFKHPYQASPTSDMILKDWCYTAMLTTSDFEADIVLTRTEAS